MSDFAIKVSNGGLKRVVWAGDFDDMDHNDVAERVEQLTAERDQLRAEVERLKGENADTDHELAKCRLQWKSLNADFDVLREALRRYGQHEPGCASQPNSTKASDACDCGLDAALGAPPAS